MSETQNYSEINKFVGRRMITTSETEITSSNVLDVLLKTLYKHGLNKYEIHYLYQYYKGDQPIYNKKKITRTEINNKIVENRANEIVSFKTGYLCGEPIQYVSRSGEENIVDAITRLNEYMFAEDKSSQDQELVEWQMICGTAYRMVLIDDLSEKDESPFEMYTLDPRNTFIVYSSDYRHKPMMAVICTDDDVTEDKVYSIYTDKYYFEVVNGVLEVSEPHALGMIPIFEYKANNARLGAFEIVMPILDAINNLDSGRMDSMEGFINAFWKFVGCKIDKETYQAFLEEGAILIPPNDSGQQPDVDLVTRELNQTQTQTQKDDMYKAILDIVGMPSTGDGNSSDSSNNGAVILKNGWEKAEARAKDSENMFKKAEKQMLKLVLRICNELRDLDLQLKDVELKFTRRNYENILSKSQVLTTMLNNEKIHPQLAFQSCGMFPDSESAYAMSMQYYNEMMEKWNPVEVDENEEEETE